MKVAQGELSKSFFWATSGTIIQVAAQLAALTILARLLSPVEFGVVTVAMLVTQLALVFSEFGVGPYVVQRAELSESFLASAFMLSCAFGFILALIIWILAPVVAISLGVPDVTGVLRAYSVVFLIKGLSGTQEALAQRELAFRFLARADGWSFVVGYAAVSVLAAFAGFSFWAVVIGHISQALIKAGFVVGRYRGIYRGRKDFEAVREIITFGSGQTLSRLASYVGSQADSYVVASSLGVTTIGIYGRANQLVTMPAFYLGQIFDKVIFPAVSRFQSDRNRVGSAYQLAIFAILIVSVPLAVGTWLFAEPFVQVVLGSGWDAVITPVKILAVAIPFRMIHKVSDPIARALGATFSRAWRQWLFVAVVLLGSLSLRGSGLSGVASAVVIACGLDAILMATLCAKLASMRWRAFVVAAAPALRLGVLTALVSLGSLVLAFRMELGAFATLFVGGVLSAVVVVGLTFSRMTIVLGSSGGRMFLLLVDDIRMVRNKNRKAE